MPGTERSLDTITDVLETLDAIIADTMEEGGRVGYFAAIYRKMTAKVAEGMSEARFFDDGERMERLDVVFADRYLAGVRSLPSRWVGDEVMGAGVRGDGVRQASSSSSTCDGDERPHQPGSRDRRCRDRTRAPRCPICAGTSTGTTRSSPHSWARCASDLAAVSPGSGCSIGSAVDTTTRSSASSI